MGLGCNRDAAPDIEHWAAIGAQGNPRLSKAAAKIMWLGRGIENQWPAGMFHHEVDKAIAEDRDILPAAMTTDEIRHSYLMVLLGIVPPAGQC